MDVSNIIQIITNLGFPIAVCLICFWYINKKDEKHVEEVGEMAKALNNNTLVMQKLVDRLENLK